MLDLPRSDVQAISPKNQKEGFLKVVKRKRKNKLKTKFSHDPKNFVSRYTFSVPAVVIMLRNYQSL